MTRKLTPAEVKEAARLLNACSQHLRDHLAAKAGESEADQRAREQQEREAKN